MACFQLRRDDFVTPDQAQRIHETALRILQEVGLSILREDLRKTMVQAGFTVRSERVFFEPRVVDRYLDEHRRRLSRNDPEPPEDDMRLTMGVSSYCHHVHDLETNEIVPYTTERLIEMTKFVDTLTERGVLGSTPGFPLDVPPHLQPLIQYRIGAEHSRHGGRLGAVTSPHIMEHIFEMAEVMEQPIRSLPVYVFSPLRLGGDSLDLVLRFRDRLDHIHVSSMPSAGATAPIHLFGALALAVAEILGTFVVLTVTMDIPIDFSIGIFPFDLRATSMVFGSPENFLFRLASMDLNTFYHGYRSDQPRGSGNIHVMAKLPGPQAAAEKASLMTAGALLGEHRFSGGGALSLDEVFSPEQLLIDCEIKDHVQHLIEGLILEDGDQDWVEIVREGSKRGFVALDSTLDNYHRLYWYPRLFERGFLGAWQGAGSPRLHDHARELFRQNLAQYNYELDSHKRAELYCIWKGVIENVPRR